MSVIVPRPYRGINRHIYDVLIGKRSMKKYDRCEEIGLADVP
jgi:hypothetical protein